MDSKKSLEKSFVEAVVWIPHLKKSAKVRRTLKSSATLEVTPDGADVQAIFRQLEAHPEIALSRREIIRFVLTEPGQRAKEVQALLKLDALENVRMRLQKIANAAQSASKTATTQCDTAKAELIRGMAITEGTDQEILDAANKRRQILGLEPLASLGPTTSIRDGLALPVTAGRATTNKAVAKADTDALQASVQSRLLGNDFGSHVAAAKAAVNALVADESLLKEVVRDDFLKTALDLYEGATCPVCDTPKTLDELTAIVHSKRTKLQAVKTLRADAEKTLSIVRAALDAERDLARPVYLHSKLLLDESDSQLIAEHGQGLAKASTAFAALLPLDKTLACLEELVPSRRFTEVLKKLQEEIGALRDPSDQDAAREYLFTAHLRLDALRKARKDAEAAEGKATRAKNVFEIYSATSTSALEKVYDDVQTQFAVLYRRINSDDESGFEAKLTPSHGKLSFGVDFYGRGFFPPGAYHSEGHQDGMGLCLYLALMRYILGAGFTFAVLDDVLMSVDAGHRREVSKLLKTEFPGTQFVLTTHDRAWMKFMNVAGLVGAKDTIEFRKWTVDEGPSDWRKGDLWAEIREKANVDDVPGAAAALRRSLEYLSGEACEALRAKVEFRAHAQHDLGDLLDPAIAQMRSQYKDVRQAAQSWSDQEQVDAIRAREAALAQAATAAKIEQWQINPAVHYNQWENLQKTEMIAVIDAFQTLFEQFKCDQCEALIEVSPRRGSREFLHCMCGKVKYSFMSKPKTKTAA